MKDRKVKFQAKWEAARSDVIPFRVVSKSNLPSPVEEPIADDPKLLAMLEIKNCPLDHPEIRFGTKYFVLTLTNLSKTRYIGVIDPYSFRRMSRDDPRTEPLQHPVHWIYRGPDGTTADSNKPSLRRYPRKRTDFVIIPPDGVAARVVVWLPSTRGEHFMSVELEKGIVIDEEKLDILRDEKIAEGWTLGGTDHHVLHPDSVVSLRTVVE